MIKYLVAYGLGTILFYIFSPIFYKKWDWSIYDSHSHPPPELTSLAWPAIIVVYALYYFAAKVLGFPLLVAGGLHRRVAFYITEEAAEKRREKKAAKKERVAAIRAKEPIDVDEALDALELEERTLGYREANCKDCGQSLNKTA